MNTDQIVLLVAAGAVAAGLFYVGRQIGEANQSIEGVTSGSPVVSALLGLGGSRS